MARRSTGPRPTRPGPAVPVLPGTRPFQVRQARPAPAGDLEDPVERAERFGHHLGRIVGQAPATAAPEPIQRQSGRSAGANDQALDVGRSSIHGRGVFAKRAHSPGSKIGVAAMPRQGGDGKAHWELSSGARFTNHQTRPNAKNVKEGGRLVLAATQPIRADDEVTVDYNHVGQVVGDDSLTWRGKKVPDANAESFFRREG